MAKFVKGHKKVGGNVKGSVHRKTRVELACEAAANGLGVDPFKVMADVAADKSHPDCLIAAKELAKYLEPQKKAMEVTASGELGIKVTVVDYTKE